MKTFLLIYIIGSILSYGKTVAFINHLKRDYNFKNNNEWILIPAAILSWSWFAGFSIIRYGSEKWFEWKILPLLIIFLSACIPAPAQVLSFNPPFVTSGNMQIYGGVLIYLRPQANNCNMLFMIDYFSDTVAVAGWNNSGTNHYKYIPLAPPTSHFAIILSPRTYYYTLAIDSPYTDERGYRGMMVRGSFIIK